jgi:ABC-type uncharacterized transport system substrate-binding protein
MEHGMRGVGRGMLLLAGLAVDPTLAAAHPHVWVDAEEAMWFDDQGRIEAVQARWRFDDLYSAFSLEGLDTNGDAAYTVAELEPLRAVMHDSLRSYGYFTTLTADNRPVAYAESTDVKLSVDGGILVLDAVLPLAEPVDPRRATVELRVLDPTYYVALDVAEVDPVRLDGAVPDGCAAVVEPPRNSDDQGATLSDDLATNLELARSYAIDFAPSIRVVCS